MKIYAIVIISALSMSVYAGNLIDNPVLIYTDASQSNSILNQKITITRTFNNIKDLADKLNNIEGIQASIKNQSVDKPTPVNVVLNNASIDELLNKTCPKLGYHWNLENNVVVLSALNPLLPKNPSYNITQNITKAKSPTPLWTLNSQEKTLRNALTSWCKTANWQLVWNVHADYPITTTWTISGSFESAINEVLKASQSTDTPLQAVMHDSNRVLEVYSPAISK